MDTASRIWNGVCMIDLADLRTFARIANVRSVSGAARALRAPKSSVSRSLTRLEAAVDAILIERSTRPVRLTDAGTLLYRHALRILNEVEEARTALGGLAGVPRGTLRVNAPFAFTEGLLAPMLPAFLRHHPEIRVVLDIGNRRIDVLAEEVDVVIRTGPLVSSGLIARRLATPELWLCASPHYLAARGVPGSVADLAEHDLVDPMDGATTWSFRTPDGRTVAVEICPRAVVPEPAATRAVLLGGVGIGRLPAFLATDALADGTLVRVLPDLESGSVEIHALYPSHRSLSAKVRVFIDALVAHLEAVRSDC